MTKDEAIQWAVASLDYSLNYEYYKDQKLADIAASAMTELSGKPWKIKHDVENARFWIEPDGLFEIVG